MQPEIKKAILGGIVGTIVMSLMMKFVAPMMIGRPMDIAHLIGGMMGDNYLIGLAIHIANGVFLFPLVYVFFVYARIPGPAVMRGIVWGIILWVLAASVVMPLAGAGFFMSAIGGLKAAMAALLGHVVYGALLGAITGNARNLTTETAVS
jgi:uncharacterized membrane protein YagU involved in acid resistance